MPEPGSRRTIDAKLPRGGSWAEAVAEASVKGYRDVYVLIGFGHNDAHAPAASPTRWTEVDREFPDNLRRFVAELKAVGAHPVLTTPIARRTFEGGRLVNKIAPYSDKVKAVAAETGTSLIDLNAIRGSGIEATDCTSTPPASANLEVATPPHIYP